MVDNEPVHPDRNSTAANTPAPSPLLAVPGSVPAPDGSADAGVAWHYGDPFAEARSATRAAVVIDRSHRGVFKLEGPERLSWLHTISSQYVTNLADGTSAENLSLDVNGRVEEHFVLTDIDGATWIDTERERAAALTNFLRKMVFWAKVEITDEDALGDDGLAVLSILGPDAGATIAAAAAALESAASVPTEPYATTALAGGGFIRRMPWPTADSFDVLVPRRSLRAWWDALTTAGARPAGMWTFEALRVEALRPRLGIDTDVRTIPHEVHWIGDVTEFGAVHLDKGCYRGQETVARVHNLGKPPRHLVLLHLDGSSDTLPETGEPVLAGGRTVGRIGTVVQHHELGPIALALVKRSIPVDTELSVGTAAASIDPDSVRLDDRIQAGRAAIDKLRGQ
ncbi:MAG: folate-binding protein YgfZ [Rhodococcus sp.]|nr:folate-binding protein YgfZ [Rhodococcus sp. (in: high G+C Gram-positive bacteria)]